MRASSVWAPVAASLVMVVLACFGAGCGGSDTRAREQPAPAPESPRPATADSPEARAHAETSTQTRAETSFEPLNEAQLASTKAALQTHLDAAHAAIEASDTATGIAQLQAAAAINPSHANTLSALGRAHLDAHQLEQAQRALDRALHHARDPHTRAAVLYELGLVAEARADVPVAAEHYANSLALLTDDRVAARLAALTGGTEVISHSACGWTRHGPAPQHLCHAYVRALEPGRACAYETTRPASSATAAGESGAATVYDLELDADTQVAVFSYLEPDAGGVREIFVLNAVLGGIWHSAELTWVDHPGASHADEKLADLKLSAEQLAPGGLPELVIEWSVHGHAIDPGDEIDASWSIERLGVLMLQSGIPRWLIGLTRVSTLNYAPVGGGPHDPSASSVEIKWLTRTGEVELRANDSEAPAPVRTFALGAAPQLCPAELDGS